MVDGGWTLRRRLDFDNLAQGSALVDFPVLVVIDNTRIDYNSTLNLGEDLRFVDADGSTVLPHEIESWDENGTSYVWVKVPQIDGASVTDHMWMYYGNPGAPDGQAPAAVWSAGYQGVYHLHQSNLDDSTNPGYDGTNNGSVDAPGAIAHGREFDGISDTIALGVNPPLLQGVSQTTLSAWVRADNVAWAANWAVSVSRFNGGTPTLEGRAKLGLGRDNEVLVGGRSTDAEIWRALETTSNLISVGIWYHITGVIDYAGDTISIYLDGTLALSGTVAFDQPTTPNTPSSGSHIGSDCDGARLFFDGLIDEVRISGVARSADWIAAQYDSMTDAFVTFGPEETL